MKEQEIIARIEEILNRDENPGDHAGGSGHLSDVSFHIDYFIDRLEADGSTDVTYFYTITICTEFTLYPDNPPYECRYKKRVIFASDGSIRKETPRLPYSIDELPGHIAWPMTQPEISVLIESFIWHTEQHAGDNHAPIVFPPEFHIRSGSEGTRYVCKLNLHAQPPVEFDSLKSSEVLVLVRDFLFQRFQYKDRNMFEPDIL